ncbi:MAG: hypothetical protein Q9195_004540, partial [Heterodermia aff. obscurata]
MSNIVYLVCLILLAAGALPGTLAAGFRTVGSSGCTAQMVFIPPNTTTAVFLDNYHLNYGGPGVNLQNGDHSATSYVYPGTDESVFGTEYDLETNTLKPVRPLSNTFCSAGAFYKDGTVVNLAGADDAAVDVAEGFNKIRTYAPGPCDGICEQDWSEQGARLQRWRWYPSAQTLVDGSVLIVGGSHAGGLVLNEASINEPTYEIIYQDNRTPRPPVNLPILDFSEDQNLDPGKSYNLYPILHLLPNPSGANHIFTIAGNQTIIWDYTNDELVKALPDTPLQPRTFPSSATSVLLPLRAPDYKAQVLLCGGSSGDMPNPKALEDCYTIDANDEEPKWQLTDYLPNGPQTMSVSHDPTSSQSLPYPNPQPPSHPSTKHPPPLNQDGILLPDSTVLILNGARHGSGGGFMADQPVLRPLIYNPSAPYGSRFTTQPPTSIPRLYHSVATLLPSGEVLIAGSNPSVGYSATGHVNLTTWPFFYNNDHRAPLLQQQRKGSAYPTEYRVEVFRPGYMDQAGASGRPNITSCWWYVQYGREFDVEVNVAGRDLQGETVVAMVHPGFRTHGLGMGQRMVVLGFSDNGPTLTVTAPRDPSVMPPGVYMLFVTNNGIPSEAVW